MIDRVEGVRGYQGYRVGQAGRVQPTDETFSLEGVTGKGVIYEPSKQPKKEEEKEAVREQPKVPVTARSAPRTERAESRPVTSSLWETAKEYGGRFLSLLRSLLLRVWNGTDGEGGTSQEEEMIAPPEGLEAVEDSPYLQKVTKSHDVDRLVRYVTGNGRRRAIHDMDLLTSYDRHARLVEVDPSDRIKILEGTAGDIKM